MSERSDEPKPTPSPETERPAETMSDAFDKLSTVLREKGVSHELTDIPAVDPMPREFSLPLDLDATATVFKDEVGMGQIQHADISFTEAHSNPDMSALPDGTIPAELKVNIYSRTHLPDVGSWRGIEQHRYAHYLLTQS